MEINGKKAEMEPLRNSLQRSQQSILHQTGNEFALSVYKGELTVKEVINQEKRLSSSFPNLPASFYDVLMDRLKENHFNDERLKAAVDNLIDTCIYPVPTIANVISFDKTVKVYTYNQICDFVMNGDKMSNYRRIKSQFLKLWARIDDIEKYKIETI
jgi:hypothetical protein